MTIIDWVVVICAAIGGIGGFLILRGLERERNEDMERRHMIARMESWNEDQR